MNELNGNKDICLGLDSTSTYFEHTQGSWLSALGAVQD